jgi:uncharacterized protein YegL
MQLLRYVLAPALGALIGWTITEPWVEDYGFIRDLFLFYGLGLGIVIGVVSEQSIYYRKLSVLSPILKKKWLYLLPLLGALGIKLLLTDFSEPKISCGDDPVQNNTMLVLDISSSMSGDPLDELKKAINTYVDLLECAHSEDHIAAVLFESEAHKYFDFTNDFQTIKNKINALDAHGGTNMADGLRMAFAEMNQNTNEGSFIILVADGQTNSEEVYDVLQLNRNIPIYTIGAGDGYDGTLLENVASQTKGKFYASDNLENLAGVFQEVAQTHGGITQVSKKEGKSISGIQRLMGWVLLGLFIGVTIGIVDIRPSMMPIGIIGGVVGGAISSMLFEVVNTIGINSGSYLRLTSFVLYGAIIGLAVFIASLLFRSIKKDTGGFGGDLGQTFKQ